MRSATNTATRKERSHQKNMKKKNSSQWARWMSVTTMQHGRGKWQRNQQHHEESETRSQHQSTSKNKAKKRDAVTRQQMKQQACNLQFVETAKDVAASSLSQGSTEGKRQLQHKCWGRKTRRIVGGEEEGCNKKKVRMEKKKSAAAIPQQQDVATNASLFRTRSDQTNLTWGKRGNTKSSRLSEKTTLAPKKERRHPQQETARKGLPCTTTRKVNLTLLSLEVRKKLNHHCWLQVVNVLLLAVSLSWALFLGSEKWDEGFSLCPWTPKQEL